MEGEGEGVWLGSTQLKHIGTLLQALRYGPLTDQQLPLTNFLYISIEEDGESDRRLVRTQPLSGHWISHKLDQKRFLIFPLGLHCFLPRKDR